MVLHAEVALEKYSYRNIFVKCSEKLSITLWETWLSSFLIKIVGWAKRQTFIEQTRQKLLLWAFVKSLFSNFIFLIDFKDCQTTIILQIEASLVSIEVSISCACFNLYEGTEVILDSVYYDLFVTDGIIVNSVTSRVLRSLAELSKILVNI